MKKWIAAPLCALLLAGCAQLPHLSGGSEAAQSQSAAQPVATPEPEVLYYTAESECTFGPAALQAYADARGIVLEAVQDPAQAGICISMQPNSTDKRNLLENSLVAGAASQAGFISEKKTLLPASISRYGYLADGRMLQAIIDGDLDIDDLKNASWDEWEDFVLTVSDWIEDPAADTVTLNGVTYQLVDDTTGETSGLNGVFALDTETGFGMAPLTAAFAAAGGKVDEEHMTGPLNSVFATFALETEHLAGANGSVSRGSDFTPQNSADAAALLAGGKALFFRGSVAMARAAMSSEAVENLVLIPLKYSFEDSDITGDEWTVEQLNRTAVLASEEYLSIPLEADDEQVAQGQGFLLWLYTSSEGTGLLYGQSGENPSGLLAQGLSAAQEQAVNEALTYGLTTAKWPIATRKAYVSAMLNILAN